MARVALGLSPIGFAPTPLQREERHDASGARPDLRLAPPFALIAGTWDRSLQQAHPLGRAFSVIIHVALLGLFLALAPRYAKVALPPVPDMWAFTASAPAPLAPGPPPPKASVKPEPKPETAAPEPVPQMLAAIPVAAPVGISPETGLVASTPPAVTGLGVEGGVSWGISGGFVLSGLPQPPPPPPPVPPAQPIRVGGDITEPALLYKVNPEYPAIAQAALLEGIVILEATVDAEGRVESVRVLRSGGTLLDRAAIDAVSEWRYSPLIFHGKPHPFILTVTVSFSLERPGR